MTCRVLVGSARAYANRTDLQMTPDMSQNTAATGGGVPTPAPRGPAPSPEDSLGISDPTERPGEPITAGMNMGAGPGSEALAGFDPRAAETARFSERWGGVLDAIVKQPDTPDSVRVLSRYLRGFR